MKSYGMQGSIIQQEPTHLILASRLYQNVVTETQ